MSWPTVSFGDLIRFSQNGFGARVGSGDPAVVLRLADVDSEHWAVAQQGLRAIGMSAADRVKYALNRGDLLVVRVNGSPAIAGRVVPYAGPPGFAFCDHFIRFQLDDGADPKFVGYQFQHQRVRSQVERGMVSTAGQHTVSQRTFRDVRIELPALHEQQHIIAAIETHFSRLDAAVASLHRAKTNVKRARAGVLQAAVEGRLVPTEAALARAERRDYEPASALLGRILAERKAAWPSSGARGKYKEPVAAVMQSVNGVAEGWCLVALSTVADVQLGQQRHPVHAAAQVTLPYVRAANITWNGLDLGDVKYMGFPNPRRYSLEAGDVLLSEASGSPMEAGKPAIWRGEIPGACFQKTVLRVRPFNKALVLPEYLRYRFLDDCWSGRFANAAPGVGIVHLTAERMLAWPVSLPPLPEQHRIVAEVDRRLSVLDALDATLDANLARCARLRQSILQRAFSGRLVPPLEPSADSILAETFGAATELAVPTRDEWARK